MTNRPAINKEFILSYVGSPSFQRGEDYVAHKAISQGKVKFNTLTALCQGHEFDPYKVEALFDEKGITQSHCSCPVGAGGKCKHVAALLLTWLDHPEEFAEWETIREDLKNYDSQTLIELIDLLEDKIEGSSEVIQAFQQNLRTSNSPPVAKYFRRIQEAFNISQLPWYHPSSWGTTEIAFSLERVRSDVNDFIETHQMAEAIKIYQVLIQSIFNYLDDHRDPFGNLGSEIIECIKGLDKIIPNVSEDLRPRIFKILFRIIEEQMYRENNIGSEEAKKVILRHVKDKEKDTLVSWLHAIRTAQSRQEEEAPWIEDFLIDLQKEALDPEVYLNHYRETYQTGKLIESLLQLGRLQEAKQAAKQKEYSSQVLTFAQLFIQYHHEKIAEEIVVEASKHRSDVRLLQWLKDFYRQRDQIDKALKQALKAWYIIPRFTTYQEIQELARSQGQWETTRQEMLDFIKDLNYPWLLVEIYLDDKDFDKAIQAFQAAPRPPGLFRDANRSLIVLRLASAVRHKYPEVAIKIYEEAVQDFVDERSREGYKRATDFLKMIRSIYQDSDQNPQWEIYLKEVLQTYSRFKALKDEMRRAALIEEF